MEFYYYRVVFRSSKYLECEKNVGGVLHTAPLPEMLLLKNPRKKGNNHLCMYEPRNHSIHNQAHCGVNGVAVGGRDPKYGCSEMWSDDFVPISSGNGIKTIFDGAFIYHLSGYFCDIW